MSTNTDIKDPSTIGVGGLKGLGQINENINPSSEHPYGVLGDMTAQKYAAISADVTQNSPAIEYLGDQLPQDYTYSKYDKNIVTEDQLRDLTTFRANEQSNLLKAANAFYGGILSGLATAVEDAGYLLDLEEWGKVLSGEEVLERNWLSELMVQAKDQLNQVAPIYERESDPNSFSQNFLKWSTLKSGLDSAVGFALPGMGIGKGVNALQKGLKSLRATAYISKLAEANKATKALDAGMDFLTSGKSGQVASEGVTALLLNDAEGKMMAMEQGDEAKNLYLRKKVLDLIELNQNNPNYSYEQALEQATEIMNNDSEFQHKLADEQTNFVNRNRLFMLGDMFALRGLLAGQGLTRNILKDKGIKQTIKNLSTLSADNLLLQNIKEGVEEVSQNVLQSEGLFQIKKSLGLTTPEENEQTLTDRILNFGTSTQALVEGAMGFLSGGIQRGLLQKAGDILSGDPLGTKRKNEYSKLQNLQKEILNNYTADKFNKLVEAESLRIQASESVNSESLIKSINQRVLNQMSLEAFQNGTTEQLENFITEINNLSPAEAQAKGYDSNYKEITAKALQDLKQNEKLYIKYSGRANTEALVRNRLSRQEAADLVTELNSNYSGQVDQLYKELITKGETKLVEELQTNPQVLENYINSTNDINSKNLSVLQNTEAFSNLQETYASIKAAENFITEADKRFTYEKSTKGEQDYVKEMNLFQEELNKNLNDQLKQQQQTNDKAIEDLVTQQPTVKQKKTIIEDLKKDQNSSISPEVITRQEGLVKQQEELTKAQSKVHPSNLTQDQQKVDTNSTKQSKSTPQPQTFNKAEFTNAENEPSPKSWNMANIDDSVFNNKSVSDAIPTSQLEVKETNTKKDNSQYFNKNNEIKEDNPQKNYSNISSESYINSEEDYTIDEKETNNLENTQSTPIQIAYLGRKYKKTKDGNIKDSSDEIETSQGLDLLADPTKIPVGTKLIFKLDSESTTSKLPLVEGAAIRIYVKLQNKEIAVGWVPLPKQGKDNTNLLTIREQILDKLKNNQTVTGKVTEVKDGLLIFYANNKIAPISKAFLGENIPIKIYKPEGFSGVTTSKIPTAPEPQVGRVYALMPKSNGYYPIRLIQSPLSADMQSEITRAINSFINYLTKGSLNFSEVNLLPLENSNKFNDFKNKEGKPINFDLSSIQGLKNYISLFTYVDPTINGSLTDSIISKGQNYPGFSIDQKGNTITISLKAPNDSIKLLVIEPNSLTYKEYSEETNSLVSTPITNLADLEKFYAVLQETLKHKIFNVSNELLEANNKKITWLPNTPVQSYKEYISNYLYSPVKGQKVEFTSIEAEPKVVFNVQNQYLFTLEEEVAEIIPVANTNNEVTLETSPSTTTSNIDTNVISKFQLNINDINLEDSESFAEAYKYLNLDLEDTSFNKDQEGLSLITANTKKASVNQQQQLVESISQTIASQLLKSETGALSLAEINSILAQYKQQLINLQQRAVQVGKTKLIEHLQEYLDNWQNVHSLVKQSLSNKAGIKLVDLQNEEVDNTAEFGNENGDFERNNYSETYSLEVDPRDSLSTRLKLFFSFVPKTSSKNYLTGEPRYETFDIIYNNLTSLLAGTYPTFDQLLSKLREANTQNLYPWLPAVIQSLEQAPAKLKQEFVVTMAKHYVDMRFVMWEVSDLAQYTFSIWESNANSNKNLVLTNWTDNLSAQDIVTVNKEGEEVYNKEVVSSIIDQFKALAQVNPTQNTDTLLTNLSQVFQKIGISLSTNTLRTLVSGNFTNAKGQAISYKALFQSGNLIGVIIDQLSKIKNTSKEVKVQDVSIFNEGIVRKLASLEAINTTRMVSNSFRTGDKTIYSFTNNKYLTDRTRELLQNPQLLSWLSKCYYNSPSSWLQELQNPDSLFRQVFQVSYLDINAIKEKGGINVRSNNSMNNLPELEHEVIKLAFFTNNNRNINNTPIGNLFFPTTSDKSAVMPVTVPLIPIEEILNKNLEVTESIVNFVYNHVVLGEINRAINASLPNTNIDIDGYQKGSQYFYTIPALNNLEDLFINLGDGRKVINPNILSDSKLVEKIKKTIFDSLESLIQEQIKDWSQFNIGATLNEKGKLTFNFVDKNFAESLMTKYPANINIEQIQRILAANYAINYFVGYANFSQLFYGDLALYYKKDSNAVAEAFNNAVKRLAADIAPGMSADWSKVGNKSTTFTLAVLEDAKGPSLSQEYYKKLGFSSSTYGKITSTDAQELTTLKEHLNVMVAYGKITKDTYEQLLEKYKNSEDFTQEELDIILQPIKPVYTGNRADTAHNIDVRTYIKSSSFPLIPQLTKGLEIDFLREAMEQQGIDRVAYYSAVKVGAPQNKNKVWNSDGTLNKENLQSLKFISLSREGFRIQQEVPYHGEKDKINGGTQERKLLFQGIKEIPNFEYHDKKYTGEELEQVYIQEYKKLWELQKAKLEKELIDPETNQISLEKLAKILQEEAISRGYSINERLGLTLDTKTNDFKFPLWGVPASSKYEALLLSIINNRVRKIKIPGGAFILGSEEGFKVQDESKVPDAIKNKIVFTSKWTGQLLPQGINSDGSFRNTQVLVPSRFRDQNGNLIDLTNEKYSYRDQNGILRLKEDKIPSDILKSFGFRIPTQGHSSMAGMEIVGFLPNEVGDLIIASKDFTVQMGSDFDIDKLYTYIYQTIPFKGKIRRLDSLTNEELQFIVDKKFKSDPTIDKLINIIFETNVQELEELDKQQLLESLKEKRELAQIYNNLLDIHLSVMSNPDPQVQKKIATPISFGKLKGDKENLADDIDKWRQNRFDSKDSFNGFSPVYQRKKYLEGTSGKAGVAIFSTLSMFVAGAEGKNLHYVIKDEEGNNSFVLKMGDLITTGDLSTNKVLNPNSNRSRSQVVEAFQSSSVDNVKEQILAKMNINDKTFSCINAMAALGFEEDSIAAIIAQDIIFDYVKAIAENNSSFKEQVNNIEQEVINTLKTKYLNLIENENFDVASLISQYEKAPTKTLLEYIKEGPKKENYALVQIAVLNNFVKLTKVGRTISHLASISNLESKGLPQGFIESLELMKEVDQLMRTNQIEKGQEGIENGRNLIGTYDPSKPLNLNPTTIQGLAISNSLPLVYQFLTSSYKKDLFPYLSAGLQEVTDRIINKLQLQNINNTKVRKQIFEALKSYLYTSPFLINRLDVNEVRKTLFLDSKSNNSLAKKVFYLKQTNYGQSNPFLTKLLTQLKKGQTPSLVKYNASASLNLEETEIIQGFLALITDNKNIYINFKNNRAYESSSEDSAAKQINTKDLALDLILATYLSGGIQQATQFVKYIPLNILNNLGLGEFLQNINFNDPNTYAGFEQQFIQHNPRLINAKLTGYKPDIASEEKIIVLKKSNNILRHDQKAIVISAFKPILDENGLLINDKFGSIEYKEGLPTLVYVPYVSVKTEYGYLLYKQSLDEKGEVYYQLIPTLGLNGVLEYQSELPETQVAQSIFRPTIEVTDNTETSVNITPKVVTNQTKPDFKSEYTPTKGTAYEVLRKIFNKRVNSKNQAKDNSLLVLDPELNVLSKIGAYIKNLGTKFKFHNDVNYISKYDSKTNTILLNTNKNIDVTLQGWSDLRYVEEFVLHESTHAVMDNVVSKFLEGDTSYYKLGSLKLIYDNIVVPTIKEYINNNQELDSEIKAALSSFKEFMALSLSSRSFRNFLNSKNLLDKIDSTTRDTLIKELGLTPEESITDVIEKVTFEILDREFPQSKINLETLNSIINQSLQSNNKSSPTFKNNNAHNFKFSLEPALGLKNEKISNKSLQELIQEGKIKEEQCKSQIL